MSAWWVGSAPAVAKCSKIGGGRIPLNKVGYIFLLSLVVNFLDQILKSLPVNSITLMNFSSVFDMRIWMWISDFQLGIPDFVSSHELQFWTR